MEHGSVLSVILQPIGTDLMTVLNNLLIHPFDTARIVVAWARHDAVMRILPALKNFVARGGYVEVIVGLNEKGTTYEALRALLSVADVHVFYKHPAQTFHPKLFMFEDHKRSRVTAIVGSNNLTVGGIWSNIELSLRLDLDLTRQDQKQTYKELDSAYSAIKAQLHRRQIMNIDDLNQLLNVGLIAREHDVAKSKQRMWKGPRQRTVPRGVAADLLMNLDPPRPLIGGARKRRKRVRYHAISSRMPLLYVRTLTQTEIGKIRKTIPGTLEFGIPLTARAEAPRFWKWRESPPYESRRTNSGRIEWEWYADVLVISDQKEVLSQMRLWDYARRHEFRIQVDLRPSSVTRDDIIAFEKTDMPDRDFIVRHVQKGSPSYSGYAAYLSKHAAQHWYGYGP